MLLMALCLVGAILGYGGYTAKHQTDMARETITAQMSALAHNLATAETQFVLIDDQAAIQAIATNTATVPGIFSVLITDPDGKPINEQVNQNGNWMPRFRMDSVAVPANGKPLTLVEPQNADSAKRDFLAGDAGTISAWHPIETTGIFLGWVRVSYRLDTFDKTTREIWTQAILVIVLAIGTSLYLVARVLETPMRALRDATRFAGELDHAMGEKMVVSHRASEIEAMGHALNAVSDRLASQNRDLANQKFALDQHAIVSITDLQGTITYANDRFCKISGYTREELVGQNHRIVKSDFHPPEVFQDLWHTITQGRVWRNEVKNRRKDGSFYWVSATIVPLLGSDGLPKQYIAIRTDITANKELEASLQDARNVAEAAAVAKSQFLANMSHEIRTPMNAILGMLKLLHSTNLDRRQFDYASKTEGAAKSLLGLLNDILDFSKVEAGKMALDPQPFRIDRLMRDLSVVLSANLGNKPIEVLFDIDAGIPEVLLGDSMRLQQVLVNLGGNAVKFTNEGQVIIGVHLKSRQDLAKSKVAEIEFSVRDSGIGIAEENQAHIFSGFSQAEASTTRRFGGTGLGLAISKRLVEIMGGQLVLQSQLGVGSTFSFTLALPVVDIFSDSLVGQSRTLRDQRRVLVVDDNAIAGELMLQMTRSWGWQAQYAASGAAALQLIETSLAHLGKTEPFPYQVVYLDWHMPGMDGWETARRIRELAAGRSGPAPLLIMVTAHGRESLSQRTQIEQDLLNGFLVKPVTASMLYDAVVESQASGARLRQAQRPGSSQRRLHGMRVLVVEDNLINQQVAEELLNAEGALVSLAANGRQGVEAVAAAKPQFDAVLMDIQMPVMDGYAATSAIRTQLGLADLPIVAMTANAMASDRDACLNAGMNEHVGKPFDLGHLVSVLIRLTGYTAPEPGPATVPAIAPSDATLPPARRAAPLQAFAAEPYSIDVTTALDRMSGLQSLYLRAAHEFDLQLRSVVEEFRAALAASKPNEAITIMHTLKGTAGTLGATALSAHAARIEKLCKEGASAEMALQQADALEAAVQATRQSLSRVLAEMNPDTQHGSGAASGNAPNGPGGDYRPALRALMPLLSAFDLSVLEKFNEMRPTLESVPPDQFKRLEEAMQSLDLPRALELCSELTGA
jgi:PAS domain S-box-containing protein